MRISAFGVARTALHGLQPTNPPQPWTRIVSAVLAPMASGSTVPPLDVVARKKEVRAAIKAALKRMPPEDRATESKAICEAVQGSAPFNGAASLGVYVHCERLLEVDTSPLLAAALAANKRCFVPLVQDQASNMKLLHIEGMDALFPAPPFGILEPRPTYPDGQPRQDALQGSATPLDVLIMPGLGFDLAGNRLGRGGGYYDKAIARLCASAQAVPGRQPPLLVALAFAAQLVDSIPAGPHDAPVDVLVLPSGMHACTARGRAALGLPAVEQT